MRLAHRAAALAAMRCIASGQTRAGVIRSGSGQIAGAISGSFSLLSGAASGVAFARTSTPGAAPAVTHQTAAAMPSGSLPSFAARTKTSAACSSGRRQHVIFELRAQRDFLDFARRGVRDFADEHDVVGHPPFGDLAVEEGEQVFLRRALAFLEHDDEQRPLVPFRMVHADYGGFGDFGMTDREVFQFDRGNPFAAGFDYVLGAIGDVEIAVAVDGADIAGVEKTFGVENFAVVLEIGFGHRGTTHFQTAESLAIPRHAFAGIVGDPHLDAERRMALLLLYVEPRLAFEPGIF